MATPAGDAASSAPSSAPFEAESVPPSPSEFSSPLSPSERQYSGGCHCGAVRIEVRVPLDRHSVLDCNCSMCSKKGFLHLIATPQQFRLVQGHAALSLYTFGTRTAKHLFCRHCGIAPFYRPRSHPTDFSVNLLALDDYQRIKALFKVEPYNGQDWEGARAELKQVEDAAASSAAPSAATSASPVAVGDFHRVSHAKHPRSKATHPPAPAPSLPPPLSPVPSVIRIGVICVRGGRTVGAGSYSPGLAHDAKLYERALGIPLAYHEEDTSTAAAAAAAPSSADWPSLSPSSRLVRFDLVPISPSWSEDGSASRSTLDSLAHSALDVIVCLEELGSADMIALMRGMKVAGGRAEMGYNPALVGPPLFPPPSPPQQLSPSAARTAPAPVVVFVPNLEVLDGGSSRSKWKATLDALHTRVVDLILVKMPRFEDFVPGARRMMQSAHMPLDPALLFHAPHTAYLEDSSSSSTSDAAAGADLAISASPPTATLDPPARGPDFFDPSRRKTILHFAGSSPHKNTLENCKAGLQIVRELNAQQMREHEAAVSTARGDSQDQQPLPAPPVPFRFVVFLCAWPSKKPVHVCPARFSVKAGCVDALRQMAADHPDEFQLIASGFISYADRADLYAQTRLALCASKCEGFGHYILEAAAAGCLVVTTAGAPMHSLLTEPGTFALARPTGKPQPQCFGLAYTVSPESIVAAARSLQLLDSEGYSSDLIARCTRNEAHSRAAFEAGMKRLQRHLIDMVRRNRDAAEAHRHGNPPPLQPPQSLLPHFPVSSPPAPVAPWQHLPHTLPAFFADVVPLAAANGQAQAQAHAARQQQHPPPQQPPYPACPQHPLAAAPPMPQHALPWAQILQQQQQQPHPSAPPRSMQPPPGFVQLAAPLAGGSWMSALGLGGSAGAGSGGGAAAQQTPLPPMPTNAMSAASFEAQLLQQNGTGKQAR